MNPRARLLFLSPWPSFWAGSPGVGCSDEDEVHRALVAQDYDVHYLLPRVRGVEAPGPRSHFHPGPDLLPLGAMLPSALRRALRFGAYQSAYTRLGLELAHRLRPHIVIGHSYYASWPAARVARSVGARSVGKHFGVMTLSWTADRGFRRWHRNWEMLHALRAPLDRVVVLDDGTRGEVAVLAAGVAPGRLCFWPNGLETDLADRPVRRSREELRREAGVGEGEALVVSLARLSHNKRLDLALRALAALPGPQRWRMAMLGDGPELRSLQAMARNLGLEDRVHWAGAVPHLDVPDWLRAGDVLVSCSELTNRSLSTLEAMLLGLAVVVTDTGATRDLLHDGVNGLVCAHSVEALGEGLARLLGDPQLRGRLGARARMDSRAFPGWHERTRRECDLYEELLREGARRTD